MKVNYTSQDKELATGPINEVLEGYPVGLYLFKSAGLDSTFFVFKSSDKYFTDYCISSLFLGIANDAPHPDPAQASGALVRELEIQVS